MAELDLQNFKSMMSDYVTPDTYRVQVEDIDASDRDRNDKRQMRVTLRIMAGDFKGSQLVERLPLDKDSKALFRTVAFLSGMGIATPRKRFSFDENALIGRKLDVQVSDNEYNGRTTSQVTSWLRVKGSSSASTEQDIEDAAEAADETPATVDGMDIDLDEIDVD